MATMENVSWANKETDKIKPRKRLMYFFIIDFRLK